MKNKTKLIPRPKKRGGSVLKEQPSMQEVDKNTVDVNCPVVGIGASAGGLAAFEAFFSGMPTLADPGIAFVLVQHLDPNHKSILTELVRRYTRMQVFEVEDGMTVRPNCTYIIPPNHDMAIMNGRLQLMDPIAPRGQRMPIDFFFRSLAQEQQDKAIGIVLSGTGSDGTLGIRAIKGVGGMVMVQSPDSTEYDGMPRNAIATGLVDYELPPAQMPAQIIDYVARAFGRHPNPLMMTAPKNESALQKIFILLRSQTSHDFSQYKPSTIHRRVERRMAVAQIETLEGYVKHLQQTPAEVDALFRDLLIGVTSFFRDPAAFKALEDEIIPKLFAGKPAGSAVRVWCPGCSTGEEAYSLAMLLVEGQEALKQHYRIQVFATDIDSQAIAAARQGLYPANIAADIEPVRLARFFTAETDGSNYRIHKSIRDIMIFSEQNVVKDPPFSKLDLISCRNLMIYMSVDLQKKLIPLLHYALNPDGFLFLGTSETVGEFENLFVSLDRRSKIYQRKEDFVGMLQRAAMARLVPPMSDAMRPLPALKADVSRKLPVRELTEQTLLHQIAPAAALVNGKGDVLYLHGRTGMYLEPAPGESQVNNILKMAREGLRKDLTIALRKAEETKEIVRAPNLRVKTNGNFTTVNLTIRPAAYNAASPSEPPLYLVILEEATEAYANAAPRTTARKVLRRLDSPDKDVDARIAALRQELRAKEEYLQSLNEELETSNEELKSSNEELQSVNEEFQSANEELETSKEELQSVNEELATVNAELQTKVTDLTRANNDMNNLLAGTGIGTIFVDRQLRIIRFTPTITSIINLIPGDMGRPVGNIVSNLTGYNNIVADTQAVLYNLIPREVEVQTKLGKWYMMRILPYRTLDDVIEGAVITFVDINELRKMQEVRNQLAAIVESADDAIIGKDLEGIITIWNEGAEMIYGYNQKEAMGSSISLLMPPDVPNEYEELIARIVCGEKITHYETRRRKKDGQIIDVSLTISPLKDTSGKITGASTIARDITERKQAEHALRESEQRYYALMDQAADAIFVHDDTGRILDVNQKACQSLGYSRDDLLSKSIEDIDPEAIHTGKQGLWSKILAGARFTFESHQMRKDGSFIPVEVTLGSVRLPLGSAILGIVRDITERKQVEEKVKQLNAELEQRVVDRTRQLEISNKELASFAYSVSHDLRAPLRGIDGWSLALQEDYGDRFDDQAREYLDRIRAETQLMGRLIEDMLNLSKVTLIAVELMPIDLTAMAYSIATRLQENRPDRRIDFIIQPSLKVYGDNHLMEIAVTNLLDNAVKFTGKLSFAKIEFGETEVDGVKAFFVRDNGAGFDMTYANKLFLPFQRLHKSSEFPGTGIGLATVHRIIQRHGGRIWADAQVDQGATFYFTLKETI